MLIFTFELFIEISSPIHQILTNLGKFLLTIAGRGNNLGAKIVVEKCLVTVTGMDYAVPVNPQPAPGRGVRVRGMVRDWMEML
jgi:hypothetical protein